MAGSAAEERIRAKVEALLRAEFPDARIVHELKMADGLVRLDLAAVRANAITIVEIKSERDVLKRLKAQVEAALRITGDVRVYAAEKHRPALQRHSDHYERDPATDRWKMIATELPNGGVRGVVVPNPDYIRAISDVQVLIEGHDGFQALSETYVAFWLRRCMQHMADPRALLELLWAEELRLLCSSAGIVVHARAARGATMRTALDYMTGRQIRAGVCNALRNRPFARADEAAA